MEIEKNLAKQLAYIKKTMEASGTYSNIPAYGYISAGLLGLTGCLISFGYLGIEKLDDLSSLKIPDIWVLGVIWGMVFIAAVLAVVVFTIRDARKRNDEAWNSLASRLFLSQIPSVLAAGVLTMALINRGEFDLVPSVWLLLYGVIVFSFHYFTGIEHKIQGIIFLGAGIASLLMTGYYSLIMLAVCFGGLHIFFGCIKIIRKSG